MANKKKKVEFQFMDEKGDWKTTAIRGDGIRFVFPNGACIEASAATDPYPAGRSSIVVRSRGCDRLTVFPQVSNVVIIGVL